MVFILPPVVHSPRPLSTPVPPQLPVPSPPPSTGTDEPDTDSLVPCRSVSPHVEPLPPLEECGWYWGSITKWVWSDVIVGVVIFNCTANLRGPESIFYLNF